MEQIAQAFDQTGENSGFLGQCANAALYAAAFEPACGLAQIVDHHAGTHLDAKVKAVAGCLGVEAPPAASFGTSAWYAQQLGGAAGMMVPFMLLHNAVKVGASAALGQAKINHSLLDITSSRDLLGYASRNAAHTGAAGFMYGALLKPSGEKHAGVDNFYFDRLKNGAGDLVAFGTLGFTSPYLSHAFGALAGAAETSSLTPQALKAPLAAVLAGPILPGIASGIPAGAANAEVAAWKDGRPIATNQEFKENIIGMALVGGAFGAAHWIGTQKNTTSNEKSIQGNVSRLTLATGDLVRHHSAERSIAPPASPTGTDITESAATFNDSKVEARLGHAGLIPGKQSIADATEVLVLHVTDPKRIPQTSEGKLDWFLGGSAPGNLLSKPQKITILDSSKLPEIVPLRTLEITADVAQHFKDFVRQITDIDGFPANRSSKTTDLLSNGFYRDPQLPDDAKLALRDPESEWIFHNARIVFSQPEVAALDYQGRTVYVAGPLQLLSNKIRQCLFEYSTEDAAKLTGDVSHLLAAASKLYSKPEIIDFVGNGLKRNDALYSQELFMPWDSSHNNDLFNNFLREVLEKDERNGPFLTGLKIDSYQSLSALRMFNRYKSQSDKQAIAEFINRHEDLIERIDTPGTSEHDRWTKQCSDRQVGYLNASSMMVSLLEHLDKHNVRAELDQVDHFLATHSNLPAIHQVLFWHAAPSRHDALSRTPNNALHDSYFPTRGYDHLREFFFRLTRDAPKGLSKEEADQFLKDLAHDFNYPGSAVKVFKKHGVETPPHVRDDQKFVPVWADRRFPRQGMNPRKNASTLMPSTLMDDSQH